MNYSEHIESCTTQFVEHARSIGLTRIRVDGIYVTAFIRDPQIHTRGFVKFWMYITTGSAKIYVCPMFSQDTGFYVTLEDFLRYDEEYIGKLTEKFIVFRNRYNQNREMEQRLQKRRHQLNNDIATVTQDLEV